MEYMKTPDDIQKKTIHFIDKRTIGTDYSYKHRINWINVVAFSLMHVMFVLGSLVFMTGGLQWKTYLWCIFLHLVNTLAVTVGAHRYYTHRTFKANKLLQVIFLAGLSLAGQHSLFAWARDHRLHHRYSDTDADPHNSNRGFFFSHIGWLMTHRHPLVKELGRKVDVTDLKEDPLVMFQYRNFFLAFFICSILIPAGVPILFFEESIYNAILCCFVMRYLVVIHITGLVNSAAHMYGTRPYDKNIQPVEAWYVSLLTLGEGWHNYHHTFPWDYKAAELGVDFNGSAALIRLCERLGLAWDLKAADNSMVQKRIRNTGDLSHKSQPDLLHFGNYL